MTPAQTDWITATYTNWRGDTATRRLLIGEVRYGTSKWHPKPTYLISAFDLDHPAQIWKDYDLSEMDFTHTVRTNHTAQIDVERVARAIMDHRLGAGTYDNASLWQGADAEKEETRREARTAIAAMQTSVAQAAKVLGDDQTAQNKLVEGIEDEYIKGVSMATAVGRTLRAMMQGVE